MIFDIVDSISEKTITQIETNNGRNALIKFKNCLTSTGIYYIHKNCNRWILSSTYGSYFIAIPEKKGKK